MAIINCKVESTSKWIKYCALSAAGADTTNGNPNSIIFTIKDPKDKKLLFLLSKTQHNLPVVTFSARDN